MTENAGHVSAQGPIRITPRSGKDFVNEAQVPWTPWAMPGCDFKLFCVNYQTGGFTALLKVGRDYAAPVHKHLGAAEAFVLEGGFQYGDEERGNAGDYTYEAGGAVHKPYSAEGCVMFVIAHGPIVGVDAGGGTNFAIDATLMLELSRANNAHAHVVEVGKN